MKGLTLACFILCPIALCAQTFSNKNTIQPTVATSEFAKQVNNGVTYQTGQSQTTITLFSLDVDDGLTIPIELNYDGSGIKYLQAAGEVGLGWSLSPNYRITRTVYCRPDEHFIRPSAAVLDAYINEPNKLTRDKNLTQFTYGLPSHGGMNLPTSYQLMDSEYDIFDYSIPGAGGSFVIENAATKQIVTPDNSRVKFDYVVSPTLGITKFIVTDTKGNKVVAGTNEETGKMFLDMAGTYEKDASTSWPVTKITTPNNNSVTFNYVLRDVGEFSPQQSGLTIMEYGDPMNDQEFTYVNDALGGGGHSDSHFMQEIRVREGYVTFYRRSSSYTVDSICLYNTTGVRLKKAAFYYDTQGINAGLLDSVALMGRNDWERKTYKFEYIGHGSGVPDIWGNYTSAGSVFFKAYHEQIGSEYYHRKFYVESGGVATEYVSIIGSIPLITMNRTANPSGADAGCLKKLTLPTGGYIIFFYEPNYYGDPAHKIAGPGVRITQRTEYDPVTGKSIETNFRYGVDGNGVGTISIPLTPYNFAEEKVHLHIDNREPNPHYYYGRLLTYSNDPVTDSDPFFSKYNVVTYPEVREYNNNGSVVYYYSPKNLVVWNNGFNTNMGHQSLITNGYRNRQYLGGFVYQYNLWNRPELYKKEIKNAAGTVLQREEYNYSTYKTHSLKGLKVRSFATFSEGYYDDVLVYNGIESVYDYGEYFVTIGNQLLDSKVITNIENGSSIINRIEYTYNANQQLVKEEKTGSDGLVRKTYYTYSNQYTGLTDPGVITQDVLKMTQANIVDDWVESRNTVIKVTGGVNQEFTTAANFKTLIPNTDKVRSIYRLNTPQPLATFNSASVVSGKLTPDQAYIKEGEVIAVDAFGNVKDIVTKEGMQQAIIWGYNNNTLPIAIVTKTTSANAAYTSFELTSPQGSWAESGIAKSEDALTGKFSANLTAGNVLSYSGLTPATTYILTYWTKRTSAFSIAGTQSGYPRQLATANGWTCYEHKLTGINSINFASAGTGLIDELRLHPMGAQMTSFTYEPLVGITTKTDMNNRISFYEYDNLNRLKLTRDQSGRITEVADYQYKIQP